MSWGFANAGASQGSAVNTGPDLEEITTDAVGFLAHGGQTKLRLLPQAWPADRLPSNTSSLLSVGSRKGLLAAAGPDTLVVASTDSVRKAYYADVPAEGNVKPFTPQVSISVPRVSHVAFSSDESCLVIAAEEGGGLAVYDVDSVLRGNQQSAFQMSTNGTPVRALVPNPAPELAHLSAVILADGSLMVANLKEKSISNAFRQGVSCVSWSAKGKQLVAGLEDGTAAQYDPQGNQKAQIPKPPQITESLPLTTIFWFTNDEFLTVHTPVNGDATDSTYHMLARNKQTGQFTSTKFTGDPCPAYGLPRTPAQHFIQRLGSFPPNLDEMFIISSTAGIDIGVITKSSVSIEKVENDQGASNRTAGAFTLTLMGEDARRAQMPMSTAGDMGETSPIGMVLDLSSKDPVVKPIPGDEMDASLTPLPALMLLNNEGLLCTWWVVYNESVQRGIAYPGLSSFSSQPTQAAQTAQIAPSPSAFGASSQSQQPAFGASSFGKPAAPAFGSPATPGAFGGASALGAKPSIWGGAPATQSPGSAFGKPAFGSASQIGGASGSGSAFGSAGGLGNQASASPWGTPAASKSPGAPTFGQQSTPFGGSAATKTSGFAAIAANSSGTSAFAAPGTDNKPSLASPFSSFGQTQTPSSTFATSGSSEEKKPSAFGSFGQTSNKPTSTAQSSLGSTLPPTSNGSFGAASTIGAKPSLWGTPAPAQTSTPVSNEASMSDEEGDKAGEASQKTAQPEPGKPVFGQPAKTSQQSPFAQVDNKPKGSIFGQPSGKPAETSNQSPFSQFSSNTSPFAQATDKPTTSIFGQPSTSKPTTSLFGKPSETSSSSVFKLGSTFKSDGSGKDELPPSNNVEKSLFGSGFGNMLGEATKETQKEPATPIKTEPGTDEPRLQDISTTPASVAKSEPESEPDQHDDAPLPPDFVSHKPKPVEEDLPPIAGSPPVDLGKNSQLSSPVSSIGEGVGGNEDELPSNEVDEEVDGPADEDDQSWVDDEEDDRESDEDESAEEGETSEHDEDDEDDDEDEDDEDDEEQDDTISRPPKSAAANAFGSRLSFPSQPSGGAAKLPVLSTTPAGLPKGALFAPPTKTQESPRSPSPIRKERSSTPRQADITVPPLRPQPPSRPSSVAQKQPAPPPEPEAGELSDDEDARIQEILQSEIEPTKTLEPFIAHQDYIGQDNKPGIGGQIEKVYRDINSMLDTLGLNARSLSAFVKGHETMYKDNGRERNDLEDSDDWCLIETEDLGVVQTGLITNLDSGKVDQVKEKLEDLTDLYKDAAKLRTKTSDMRKQVLTRTDPEQRATHRATALNTEAQMQQTELRHGVTKVQKLLQEAEEALTVLRASLASVPSTTQGTSGQRAPTVEAVTNTIMKMTAMIEQKSGDVDVLEAQIRRLPQGFSGLSLDDEPDYMRSSVRSINGPPRGSGLATPPRGRMAASTASLGMSGMLGSSRFQTPQTARKGQSTYGLTFTPESSGDLRRSVRSLTGSTRKKMSDVTEPEVEQYLAKQERRRRVLGALKATVEKRGTRVTHIEKGK